MSAGRRPGGRGAPWRIGLAVLALAGFAAAVPAGAGAQSWSPRPGVTRAPIEIRVTPLPAFDPRESGRTRFGELAWRGGFEMTSERKEFGGLSALRVAADGQRFVAVSDKGHWIAGRIVHQGKRPVGVADVEIAPVLGSDGKAIQTRGWYDTEAMAADGGTLYLGLERVHRILKFDFGRHGLAARGQPIAVPPGFKSMRSNKGIEALVAVPKGHPHAGALIAISEASLDDAGNIRAFLIGRGGGEFAVKRSDDFDVSDAALTPRGDLLLLERRYSLWRGVAARIRRIALAQVAPGAILDGPVIFEADMGFQIDNMEGLSVHRDADGETVLTLVSDDNYSMLQRSILLQFTLVEPE